MSILHFMLETLISSKTRIKLLLKFFINQESKAYLRQLEQEFQESTNAIRLELNKFESAGMLQSEVNGNKKFYRVNAHHPLFPEVQQIMMKYVGLDRIVDDVAKQLGDLQYVYLIGDYATGRDTGVIDLALIGEVDENYLVELVRKAEDLIQRKIRYLLFNRPVEFKKFNAKNQLMLWQQT